jgi:hypothetical protein
MDLIAAFLIALVPLTGAGMEHRNHYVPEDSPSFDCRIDGNQWCGKEAPLPDGSQAAEGYYGR